MFLKNAAIAQAKEYIQQNNLAGLQSVAGNVNPGSADTALALGIAAATAEAISAMDHSAQARIHRHKGLSGPDRCETKGFWVLHGSKH